jgi:hypothetical protein
MVVVYGDRNTCNTIPVAEQKNTLNNRTLNQTKEGTERTTLEQ